MKVLSNYLIQVLDYASCRGIKHGIESPESGIHTSAVGYLKAFENCCLQSNDRYFGLNFGSFLNLEALGSVYEVSLSVSTVGQAIALWKEYTKGNFPLITFECLEKDGSFILAIRSRVPRSELMDHIMDMIFTFVLRELRLMIRHGDVEMVLGLPYQDLDRYRYQYDRYVVASASCHQFIFDAPIEELKINVRQATAIGYVLPAFLSAIPVERFPQGSFANSVRHMVLNMSSPDIPSINEVANQFAMTARTLQRNLKKENITYREMVDDVREQLYSYLSRDQQLKTVQIAHLLGYSCSSAFLHASQRWRIKKNV